MRTQSDAVGEVFKMPRFVSIPAYEKRWKISFLLVTVVLMLEAAEAEPPSPAIDLPHYFGMFFDKSDRRLHKDERLTKECSSIDYASQSWQSAAAKTTTGGNNVNKLAQTASKPRKRSTGSALGPGCYFHESTLVKPTFNKLATDSTLHNSITSQNDSYAESHIGSLHSSSYFSLGVESTQRTSLDERRAFKYTLKELLVRNANLDASIKAQDQTHEQNMNEQRELARRSKATKKTAAHTLTGDYPSTPNLSDFAEEFSDIDDVYSYYKS